MIVTNGSHFSGSASSGKIASTGHSGSQAPQSMHSSGSITSMRARLVDAVDRADIDAGAVLDVDAGLGDDVGHRESLYRRQQASNQLPGALEQRRFRDHLVESGGLRPPQPGRVRVVREPEQRHVGVGVGDLVRRRPGRRRRSRGRAARRPRARRRGAPAAAPRASRGGRGRPRRAGSSPCLAATITSTRHFERGLALARAGEYFEAHEAFEVAWRRRRARGARLLPGARPRRRLRLPGRPRPAGRRRAPARQGAPPARRATRPSTAASTLERLLAALGRSRARSSRTAWSSAIRSHQSRLKKSSRPSTISVEPEAIWTRLVVGAHPAERAHRVGEGDPGERRRRRRARASRRAGGRRRATTPPLELASTRIEASTVPMQGAAQTAKAPPRSSRRAAAAGAAGAAPARARARARAAGRRTRGRSRSATKPAICVWVVSATTLAIAAAPAPSTTKTTVKPAMNGMLAITIRRAAPALAEPVDLDRRDGREVAGDERQHAGRDDREQPGEERDRQLLDHRSGVEAGELLVDPQLEAGASARPAGCRAPRRRRRRRGFATRLSAPMPTADGADADRREREQPGEQVEAVRRRDGEHLRAELGDEVVLDLLASSSPAAILLADARASSARRAARSTCRAARGRSMQTSAALEREQRRMVAVARRNAKRGRRRARSAQTAANGCTRAAFIGASARPDARGRASAGVAAPMMCPTWPSRRRHRDHPAVLVDEERLGVAGDAVVADQRPVVGDHRVGDVEAPHELGRRARAGPARRPRRRRRPCRPTAWRPPRRPAPRACRAGSRTARS